MMVDYKKKNNCPIRVLHVVGGMDVGGAETMIMNLYRTIDRNKVQFDFLCMRPGSHFYDEEIKALGGRIIHINNPRKVGLVRHLKDLVNALKNYGPFSTVHAHTMHHAGIVLTIARFLGIPRRISHSHSTVDPEKRTLLRFGYQYFMGKLIKINASHMIGCGKKAAQYLFGEKALNNNKVFLLANAIDLEAYNSRNSDENLKLKMNLGIPKDVLTIGHIGRFAEVKNHEFIIGIAKEMIIRNIDFRLVLVGDGLLKQQIEKFVFENNLDSKVLFLGIRKDIPKLASLFDVFLLPSLYEGFPLVLAEMQAAGTPCVVSSSVSREVDLELNLVSFVNLSENISYWIDIILKQSKVERPSKEYSIKKLKQKGYDIKNSVERLTKIYEVK